MTGKILTGVAGLAAGSALIIGPGLLFAPAAAAATPAPPASATATPAAPSSAAATSAAPSSAAPTPAADTASGNASASVGAVAYADGLVQAWGRGDRAAAAPYATGAVLDKLFNYANPGGSHWAETGTNGAAGTIYVTYKDSQTGATLELGITNVKPLTLGAGNAAHTAKFTPAQPAGATTSPSSSTTQATSPSTAVPTGVNSGTGTPPDTGMIAAGGALILLGGGALSVLAVKRRRATERS